MFRIEDFSRSGADFKRNLLIFLYKKSREDFPEIFVKIKLVLQLPKYCENLTFHKRIIEKFTEKSAHMPEEVSRVSQKSGQISFAID